MTEWYLTRRNATLTRGAKMKKIMLLMLILVVLVLVISVPVFAGGHVYVRGGVLIGPGWWGPWWWGGPYYPYPYYASPPVVIQQQPPVYQQQAEQYYWYFCPESRIYYPYVKQCPGGWQKVVPTPPAPGNP